MEDGVRKDSTILQTAGKPARIRLTADRESIRAQRDDLAYIRAEVTDEKGVLITDPVTLNFTVSGNIDLMATGNANPKEMRSFTQPNCTTYQGSCLIVLRPTGKAGEATLKATATHLPESNISIRMK
ncbi:hypothetical protein [Chitinophaga arvensicola]